MRGPFGAPDGPYWWPDRDPEPGPEVQVVVRYGDDLALLRMLRLPSGWYRHGVAVHPHDAAAPWTECVTPWTEVGAGAVVGRASVSAQPLGGATRAGTVAPTRPPVPHRQQTARPRFPA